MQNEPSQSPSINTIPLLISSILVICAFLLMPIGLFLAAFNDSADPTINAVAYGILIAGLVVILAHCVVAVAITARHLQAKLTKWVFYLHVSLLASMVATVLLYGLIMMTQAYTLLFILYSLLGNIIVGLTLACVTMTIILFVKRKTIV